MINLKKINPLPLGLWPQEDIDKAIDEILTDPIFDDVN